MKNRVPPTLGPGRVDPVRGPKPLGKPTPNMPMLQLELQGTNVQVAHDANGRTVIVVGPVMVMFGLPLDAPAAQKIADELRAAASGLVIPDPASAS